MISIVLVDDHKILQQGLRRSIEVESEFQVVATAETAQGGLAAIEQSQPDLVVFDLGLPDHTGLWLIKQTRKIHANLPILVLSMHTDSEVIASALRAGANGFLHKSASEEVLIGALHKVLRGETFLENESQQALPLTSSGRVAGEKRYLNRPRDVMLRAKEIEVLLLVSSGHSNSDIASQLGLSVSTVKARMRAVFRKLNVETRTEAVATAINLGILESNIC